VQNVSVFFVLCAGFVLCTCQCSGYVCYNVCLCAGACVCVCNCKNVNSSTFERSNRYVCVSVHVCMFVSVYLWFVCVHV
jgi:hypothetical protein